MESRTLAVFAPSTWFAGFGEHLGQSLPEAQGAVADREPGGAHEPAGAVAHQVGPGLGGFAVAVLRATNSLEPSARTPDQDQDAGHLDREGETHLDAVALDVLHGVDDAMRRIFAPAFTVPGKRALSRP